MEFEWDEAKAKRNRRKHNVDFDEAATVFADFFSRTFPDPDHSDEEERFVTIGASCRGRVLAVAHTERYGRVRIISVRRALPRERKAYEEN